MLRNLNYVKSISIAHILAQGLQPAAKKYEKLKLRNNAIIPDWT